MASIQARGGRWQLRVVHKLLPKPFFSTFSDRAEAQAYGQQLESLLDRGIVPAELLQQTAKPDNPALGLLIGDYDRAAPVAPSDRALLQRLRVDLGAVRLADVTAHWADAWVARMAHLAPGTIRKHVECLARVIDWHWRNQGLAAPPLNALRLMPRGYSTAASTRRDVRRNRRLTSAELAACRAALAGQPHADRQRTLPADAAFALLFDLIVYTGMRLSEAYSLRVDQIDLVRWVINVAGSKGHRGADKPRVVPVVPALRPALVAWCANRVGLILPFWDGSAPDKPRATTRLSKRFATLFDYAGVPDCTEHDLRHTATCAWFELRRPDGAWVFSEVEVCRVMGWTDTRMALRYASLRGEDLSARLG